MKGVVLRSVYRLPPLHNLSHLNHTSGWKLVCVSVSEWDRERERLKCSTFQWPVDSYSLRACKTTCWGGTTVFFLTSPFPLFHFYSYNITFSSHPGDTLLTPWLFYLSQPSKLPLRYRARTSSCHSRLPLMRDWNQDLEKVFNLAKVKEHVTEDSW